MTDPQPPPEDAYQLPGTEPAWEPDILCPSTL
jgi:hypothetical protein